VPGRAGISAVPWQRTPSDAPPSDVEQGRRRAEHLLRTALAASQHRLGEVVRRTGVLVVGVSSEGVVTHADGPALTQLAPAGLSGAHVAGLPAELAALLAPYELALSGDETALVCETAGRFWDASYVPVDGGVLVVARDVTEHRELVRQLESYGDVDPLTGLLNRPGLQAKMDGLITEAERLGHRVALLYADVDDFKDVNESLGHAVGDELLVGLSTRVTAALPGAALLARHGGDAFLAVLAGPDLDEAAVERHGEALLRHLSTPLTVGEVDLDLTASIGVSLYPDDASSGTELLAHADSAMYRAKRTGGGHVVRYASASDDTRRRMALTTKLRRGLADQSIDVHYQPIVDLPTGALRKVEALARWTDPEEGPISPGVFIPLAEASKQIIALGEVVISKVVHQLSAWDAQGLYVPCAAVNVSAAHLRHDRLLATIDATLARHRLDPARLEVEFTESAVMDDFVRTTALISDLRSRGIGVAIDDFGTGHSSLARLRDLPVDTVKLDRSFIAPLPGQAAQALVDAFLRLARGLSLQTVAEGVETPEQRDQLMTAGCDAAQGFLFARPMPPEDVPGWVATTLPRQAARPQGAGEG
jgi:diguanylate cyclase (GGDEF)-like protein